VAGGVCDKRGDLQLRPPVPNWGGYHPSYVVKRAELGHHGGAPNVVSLLPQAAKLYTTQLERGLTGHPKGRPKGDLRWSTFLRLHAQGDSLPAISSSPSPRHFDCCTCSW
jgi:hypothetical protein